MKNIHLLPTDNPSRIARDFDKLILNSRLLSPILYKTQNIYITSDEEIKEGDWFIQVNTSKRIKHHSKNGLFYKPQSFDKKIIITTDQKLIKDGVQAIDDEFLEWFVKNPSCDNVGIEPDYDEVRGDYYKIIIPKESNKTHYLDELPNMDRDVLAKMWNVAMPKLEPKQETLEEAFERLYPNRDDLHLKREFKNGAKWQQERMYSEEEVKRLAFDFYYDMSRKMGVDENLISENATNVDLWFEQFKKKQQ